MMAQSTKLSVRTVHKRASKKPVTNVLATCPVEGAGWCPYPFSAEQLERHLKLKAEEMAHFDKKRKKDSPKAS